MKLDRLITTEMSANIVAALLKQGLSIQQVAHTIDAPVDFVQRLQGGMQVLTVEDIKNLAKRAGQSAQMMLLDSVKRVKPELQPLFNATRRLLETSAGELLQPRHKRSRKRANRKTAA